MQANAQAQLRKPETPSIEDQLKTEKETNTKLAGTLREALRVNRQMRAVGAGKDGTAVDAALEKAVRAMPGKVVKLKAEEFWQRCPGCWLSLSNAFKAGKKWAEAMVDLQAKLDAVTERVNVERKEEDAVDPKAELAAWEKTEAALQVDACEGERCADGFSKETAKRICAAMKGGVVAQILRTGRAKTAKQAIRLIGHEIATGPVASFLASKLKEKTTMNEDETQEKTLEERVAALEAAYSKGSEVTEDLAEIPEPDAVAELEARVAAIEAAKAKPKVPVQKVPALGQKGNTATGAAVPEASIAALGRAGFRGRP